MAKKRRSPAKRRRKHSLSSGGTRKRRRSSARRSKGFLSEIGLADDVKPKMSQVLKKTVGSATGGGLSILAHKLTPPTWPKLVRVAAGLAVGFGASMFGMPSTGAGFAGGIIALNFQNGLLADDAPANYASDNSLSDMPLFLDEEGQPMVLEEGEDGQAGYRYLNEDEVRQLEEAGAFSEYEVIQD